MRRSALAFLVVAACQGQKETPAAAPSAASIDAAALAPAIDGGDPEPNGSAAGAASGSGTGSSTDVPEIANGGDSADDAEAAAKSATSAWQAVVDRDRYLARRGDKGVVEGRVGPPAVPEVVAPPAPTPPTPAPTPPRATPTPATPTPSPPDAGLVIDAGPPPDAAPPPYTWLVDDTESDGCLSIRVRFPDAPPKLGARVAITGAWAVDDDHRWYWKAETVTMLPDHPPVSDPAPPGHVIAAAPMPPDARAVSRLGDGNGTTVFQMLAPPRQDGDGWVIATELGDPPVARLILPGERPSYGGHDLRTPDERWQLKRATPYWVRIGKVRRPPTKPGASPVDTLPVIHALGAPRRVP
jgi:hypothetical protein